MDKESREEFWKIICNTYPNIITFPIEKRRRLSEVTSEYLIQEMPKKLYQFRKFASDKDSFESCSYCVRNLINDEIWGTKMSLENDQHEVFPYCDKIEAQAFLRENFVDREELSSITVERVRGMLPIIGDFFGEEGYKEFVSFCKDPNTFEMQKAILDRCVKNLELLDVEAVLNGVLKRLGSTHIACFTENDSSTSMEAHYADCSTGFIVEYNSYDLVERCKNIKKCKEPAICRQGGFTIPVFPVNYSNVKIDISRIIACAYVAILVSNITGRPVDGAFGWEFVDYLADLKIVCWKKKDWELEKEWRMIKFCNPGDTSGPDHILMKKAKASSVCVLGRTSSYNKDFMKEICKEKGIPLYILTEDIKSKVCNEFIKEEII